MEAKKHFKAEEKWENLTLANNFIFYKVMRSHPEACKHLLEILLNIQIESLNMTSEETIYVDYEAKSIRLDVFVKDSDRVYDIEVQVVNTRELPERARYYQGVMDIDMLKSGETYKKLKDSYVIFLCFEDIFRKGLPVYNFENMCNQDKNIKLGDRAFKLFFIAPLCAKMIKSEKVKRFFEFLISNNTGDEYTSKLSAYVEDARHNMQWRFQYMTVERMQAYAFEDGMEKGFTDGANKKAEEDAVNLLKLQIATPEQITQVTGLPLEKVQELAKQIKK